jgi:tetratricopeptide (TPR) repeat protein
MTYRRRRFSTDPRVVRTGQHMRKTWVGLVLGSVIGCGGGAPGSGAVKRDVGAGSATSLPAARVSYGALALEQGPPISLTASDGTGLALTRLDARAVVDGPLAFTELHLTFDNPEDRVLEGRFAITLPDRAAISRFAMKIDGKWMEAEVVERMAARRAYEDFLHRRQDPALLEKEAGNEFRARVFPIPARGTKELIVSYSQELPDSERPYVLPLRGLPRIGEVVARVQVARVDAGAIAWDELTLAERDWQPDRDLAAPASLATAALGGAGVVALRVRPELSADVERIDRATLLVDTSASRGLGFTGYAREVDALVAALARRHPGLEIAVAAFDQGVAEIYRGKAADAAGAIEPALRGRMPLGASDLGAALAWAGAQGAGARLIVVGDGVPTAGELDAARLGAAVAALPDLDRVDVVLAGGIRDRAVAEALTRGRRSRDGAVLDLGAGADEVATRIGLETRSGIAVAIDGAAAVWPPVLDGIQPGDAAVVYAWFGGDAPRTLSVKLGSERRRIAVEPAVAPLVQRAAAQAEIARLEASVGAASDATARAKLIEQIVAISVRERVLSEHTALLVLETEDDYRRFGIDRKALADILVVGARGLEVQRRDDVVMIATDALPRDRGGDDKRKDKAEKKQDVDDEVDGKSIGGGDASDAPIEPPRASDAAPPPPPRPSPERSVERRPSPSPRPDADTSDGDVTASGGASGHASGRGAGRPPEPDPEPSGPPAYTGRMATVMDRIAARDAAGALDEALAWRGDDPADVMALIALGEALEADARPELAARAYGSIIDLFGARADLRRFAGNRLDRLAAADAAAAELAIDTYRRAVEQRPDHLTGHRMLAFALVRAGRLAEAFAALEHGLAQRYPEGRFRGGDRILREDLGLVAAAWLRAEPRRKAELGRRLRAAGARLDQQPSLRFVLSWETDANDVDFHIRDNKRGHAYYSSPKLASGGELYADVTTGYGPECFTIRGAAKAAPYRLHAHYYARGPMGYGMGKLQVVRHDGKGGLTLEERPFVVMNDQAFVDLGAVE